MIIGTAGHIDHGKTSLVRALTGIDPDRLEEEKRRGITIDLGFAYQTLTNGARIGFVDVPGHEKLIHTMVSGAAGIDFVLLVVAADDGIMPQTREHLEILRLLGIQHGFVAVSRIDLIAEGERAGMLNRICAGLSGTIMQDAALFPLSSLTGEGLDALKTALAEVAISFHGRPAKGCFRHAVDRVFSLKGVGTVVTGTVVSGKVNIADTVVVQPQNLATRIRTLHVQDEEHTSASAGDRAAFNITSLGKDDIHRGSMLADPFLGRPKARFDARLDILPSEKKPLCQWFPVRLHHFAQSVNARLVFLEGEAALAGEKPLVQVVLEKPLLALSGDRFILRDTSSSRTIGGGVVIDPFAPERRRRTPERLSYLQNFEMRDDLAALKAVLAAPPFMVDWLSFRRARNLDEKTAITLLEASGGQLVESAGEQFLTAPHMREKLLHDIVAYLTGFHAVEPDLFGVGLEKLRLAVAPHIRTYFFRELIAADMAGGQLKMRGAWVGLTSHEAKLSEGDAAIWAQVSPVLNGAVRFHPPRTRDFANELHIPETEMRRILKSLARMGQLYEVAQDYFFPRVVLGEIIMILQGIAAQKDKGEFIAADLRDVLDNGRKIAILILEFFDRHGVTIRHGDKRRLNPRRLDLFQE